MPSPFAAILVATSLALAATSVSQTLADAGALTAAPPEFASESGPVLIIARPEDSDIYIPAKVRIGGDEILRRNPALIRANREEPAYQLATVVHLALHMTRREDEPPASTANLELTSAVPEPTSAILLSLSSLLLLRRRRTNPFGEERSFHEQDRTPPAGAATNQETP